MGNDTMATSLSPASAKATRDEVIKHQSETQTMSPSRRSASRGSAKSLRLNCLLIIIGVLLVCSMLFSLSIGHYHHNRYAEQTLSMASMQAKMREFLGETPENSEDFLGETPDNSGGFQEKRPGKSEDKQRKGARGNLRDRKEEIMDSNHERAVFESIIKRAKWTADECDSIPSDQKNTVTKEIKVATDLPMLPEGGVAPALESWLNENPPSSNSDYPTCYLPPQKSCDVTTYTLIIMSHTTERLQTFMDPLSEMVDSWPGLTEIIIVWNSPRETITNAINNKSGKKVDIAAKSYATKLLQWDEDASHPLRVFFSLENGLANNLLNRYHPKLKPKNEAVMYFDDDGPFWSKEAMVFGGFELWKRNSNVQVGGFPRNVRFLSDRMKDLQKVNLQKSIDIVADDVDGYSGVSHPPFTPMCRGVTGDHVEYNYFSFPDFAGHVLLPSGTFLHRNFLCFIWHPAFDELRQWVVTHKTMPDDMTVSTLISHLSGKAPRTFPSEISTSVGRRLSEIDTLHADILSQKENHLDDNPLQSPQPDHSHRRLLWKQKGWGDMREEAVNSIIGYFGSVHPGAVGWCASTPYMKPNSRGPPFVCHPGKPTLNLLPWLNEGGTGSMQCPLNSDILKQAAILAKEAAILAKKREEEEKTLYEGFCQKCPYQGKKDITCRERMQYLIDTYDNSPSEAKSNVIKVDPDCEVNK